MTLPGILAITLCLALLPSCVPEAGGPPPDPFANLHGPYLGQSLPGLDPQPFAPELLSPYGNVAGVAAAPGRSSRPRGLQPPFAGAAGAW